VEQLTQGIDRIRIVDLAGAVYSQVAQVLDEARFGEKRFAHGGLEAGFVDEGAQVVLVGAAQAVVMDIHPRHGQFQRAAGVEAGCAGVGVRQAFSLGGSLKEQRPFGLEEGEVAHSKSVPFCEFEIASISASFRLSEKSSSYNKEAITFRRSSLLTTLSAT